MLYGHELNLNLQYFTIQNPNATVIDPPSTIQCHYNRISMLEPVSQLNIPNQFLVQDLVSLTSLTAITDLSFPVIIEPLLADGSSNAYDMSLVFNNEGLTKGLFELEPPIVLQQFVNHGGIIFKVYIADDYVKCVKRSFVVGCFRGDDGEDGVRIWRRYEISRISSATLMSGDEKVKMSAPKFIVAVAKGLRAALGLHMFNFDMVGDDERDEYSMIDINYFPGYDKLSGYEMAMHNSS